MEKGGVILFEELNEGLRAAYLKMKQYEASELQLAKLREKKTQLKRQVNELKHGLEEERIDVEKLSKFSLKGIYYKVVGQREQQLEKEEEEVITAQYRYHQATLELEECEARIRAILDEMYNLRSAKSTYESLYEQKYQAIRESKTDEGRHLLFLEEQIERNSNRIKEVKEALAVGRRLVSYLEGVLSSLDTAQGYGVWDMLGGGMIATAIKHSHLDDAQSDMERARSLMKQFKKELEDVKVNLKLQVNVDGVTQFADFFLDGFFVDWFVQSQINDSIKRADDIRHEVVKILNQLVKLQENYDKEGERQKFELQELVNRL